MSCATPGCTKPRHARGLCIRCYMHWWRHGVAPERAARAPVRERLEWLFADPLFADQWWSASAIADRLEADGTHVRQELRGLAARGVITRRLVECPRQPPHYEWRAA